PAFRGPRDALGSGRVFPPGVFGKIDSEERGVDVDAAASVTPAAVVLRDPRRSRGPSGPRVMTVITPERELLAVVFVGPREVVRRPMEQAGHPGHHDFAH